MKNPSIAVIGLGYVGLPLAVGLAKHYSVLGFDIHTGRISELQEGHDRTGEIEEQRLKGSTLKVTYDKTALQDYDIFIITVPTPVDEDNHPDLIPLEMASKMIAPYLKKGSIVVYESTVYPGVTEEVCGPILEKQSGLTQGHDFFLGYSPERINPGDKHHTVETITKIVAAQTPEITEVLANIYGTLNGGRIFKAASIKVAEAAKVIENAQRDINIAFVNEIALIFSKMGISIHDVLEAAGTKWNFLPFTPGLVGGHCIGVDPFYLAECSMKVAHYPRIILSGREINDGMAAALAKNFKIFMNHHRVPQCGRLLILGLTFKENIPDLRNTKVVDLMAHLQKYGYQIDVHDPHADPSEALHYYDITLTKNSDLKPYSYDGILLAVPHQEYIQMTLDDLEGLLTPNGVIGDLKGVWRSMKAKTDYPYWSL